MTFYISEEGIHSVANLFGIRFVHTIPEAASWNIAIIHFIIYTMIWNWSYITSVTVCCCVCSYRLQFVRQSVTKVLVLDVTPFQCNYTILVFNLKCTSRPTFILWLLIAYNCFFIFYSISFNYGLNCCSSRSQSMQETQRYLIFYYTHSSSLCLHYPQCSDV